MRGPMSEKTICFFSRLYSFPENRQYLEEFALTHKPELNASAPTETLLLAVCINPEVPPAEAGYDIVSRRIGRLDQVGGYQLTVTARVFDEGRLVAAAKDAYYENWGDEKWVPKTLEEALYETVLASNSNPSPCDIGYEFGEWGPEAPESNPCDALMRF
jgi:hypothetical protein